MATTKKTKGFSDEERAAMKGRTREIVAESRGEDAEEIVLARIAEMQEPDRAMAKKLHALLRAAAPDLAPKTWYGMPSYAKSGKVVCFFQDAAKFKSRYATLGFSDSARLDEGAMWPVAFALKEWNAEVEKRIVALIKRAIG